MRSVSSAGSAPHSGARVVHRGAALAAPKKNARGGRTLWGLDTAVSPGWGAPLHTCFGGGGRKSISWLTCTTQYDLRGTALAHELLVPSSPLELHDVHAVRRRDPPARPATAATLRGAHALSGHPAFAAAAQVATHTAFAPGHGSFNRPVVTEDRCTGQWTPLVAWLLRRAGTVESRSAKGGLTGAARCPAGGTDEPRRGEGAARRAARAAVGRAAPELRRPDAPG